MEPERLTTIFHGRSDIKLQNETNKQFFPSPKEALLRLCQAVGGSHIDMWKEMCDFVVD